ncbi:hypothetical protein CPT03_21930 [Pedobacter ginsengisoli]|uniref:Uncharacterized protein n=1 Tax=Pedobacter ginsengisoli TaxID=363852 RepID=A0A2D1UBD2_9SPHI|nr:hypothetical protein [Pedobacter ginsengisoli]ATP58937.1 hypothetical protein CPT03_21930 [Pedobacter ginsengisoli]
MKTKKATNVSQQFTAEQQQNSEVLNIFTLITEAARAVVSNFENRKYRTSVLVNHLLNNNNSLVQEFISYFFNVTLTRNKNSLLVIYIGFDSEAVSRFGTLIHNMFLREVYKLTMKERTAVDIESCIRIDAVTKDIRGFFYRRLAEGENDNVTFLIDEPVATTE